MGDLVPGMQMLNMMELSPQAWEPYPAPLYSYNIQTQLNPAAPDFSPRHADPPAQSEEVQSEKVQSEKVQSKKVQSENKVVRRLNMSEKYRQNPLKMSPVSMDLVLAANYMLNDIFGFLGPQIPPRQNHRQKDGKIFPKNKKANSPKMPRSRSPSPCSVALAIPDISYGKAELLAISKSPLSQCTPQAWPAIAKNLPRLVRREGPTANIIIKEVRAIKKQGEGVRDVNNNS